jgi:hypothetical protein
LHPVKADAAIIRDGRLLVDVVEGQRTTLFIEFDEAYDGPIEVEAVSSGEEIAE